MEPNTFQQSATEFLDLTVSGGILTSTQGIKVTDPIDGTISVSMDTLGDAAVVDFNTTGGTAGVYDSRIVSFAAAGPGQANNFAFLTSGNIQLLGPAQIGSPTSPAFKLDYGSVVMAGVLNPQTPVTFTSGLFAAAPYVFLTVQSPITNEANAQNVFLESVTANGCNVQFIGTPNSTAPGTFCNWLAVGL